MIGRTASVELTRRMKNVALKVSVLSFERDVFAETARSDLDTQVEPGVWCVA